MEPPLSVVVTMPVSREPSEEREDITRPKTMPAAERYHPIEVSECTIAHRNSLFHINGHTLPDLPLKDDGRSPTN